MSPDVSGAGLALAVLCAKTALLVLLAAALAALWRPPARTIRAIWVGTVGAVGVFTFLALAAMVDWQPIAAVPVTIESPSVVPLAATEAPSAPSLGPWLLGLWLSGVGGMILFVAFAHLRLRWMLRRCVAPDWVEDSLDDWSRAAGVRRRWRLLVGRSTPPFTCGCLSPTVVLPLDWSTWPEVQRRAVLMHELAHVRGADVLAQNAALCVCCVQWFNPLAWLCLWQLRQACEAVADEAVLQGGVTAPDYAETLLTLAARGSRLRAVALPFGSPPLTRRILAVLRAAPGRHHSRAQCGMVGVAFLALVACLAATTVRTRDALAPIAMAVERPWGRPLPMPALESKPKLEAGEEQPQRSDRRNRPPAERRPVRSKEWLAGYQAGAAWASRQPIRRPRGSASDAGASGAEQLPQLRESETAPRPQDDESPGRDAERVAEVAERLREIERAERRKLEQSQPVSTAVVSEAGTTDVTSPNPGSKHRPYAPQQAETALAETPRRPSGTEARRPATGV